MPPGSLHDMLWRPHEYRSGNRNIRDCCSSHFRDPWTQIRTPSDSAKESGPEGEIGRHCHSVGPGRKHKMNRQSQKAASGGEAYQAARDINISAGLTADQMAEVINSLARQLHKSFLEAEAKAEERLREFKDDLISAFVEKDRGRSEAFRDPDFQYMIGDAQEAYIRSGDEALRGTLIDIIARRSQETNRTRLSLTLNAAASKAPLLTINEYSALSLSYILRYARFHRIVTIADFFEFLKSSAIPFVKDAPRNRSSYQYIEAQGCGSISIAQVELMEIFKAHYPYVLGKGFSVDRLNEITEGTPRELLAKTLCRSANDRTKIQPAAADREAFLELGKIHGCESKVLNSIWNEFESTLLSKEEIIDLAKGRLDEIESLFEIWDGTPIRNLNINSIGIAIAHANATRVIGLDAPLSTWIS